MAVFCSMSNLVLVSQSNVSLPLLLPFSNGNSLLPVSNSSSVITSCLFLHSGDYSYHLGPLEKKKIKFLCHFCGNLFWKRWWTLHAACEDESGKHAEFILDSSVQYEISVSLLLRWAVNGQEHDVLWIIPVSLIHYPNGFKSPHNHQIATKIF